MRQENKVLEERGARRRSAVVGWEGDQDPAMSQKAKGRG